MAGIAANSASVHMGASDTSPDKVQDGFQAGEQVTFTIIHPSAVNTVTWGLSIPSETKPDSSRLVPTSGDTVRMTPQAGVTGFYVVTALVNESTLYVIRCGTYSTGVIPKQSATAYMPVSAGAIPVPLTGVVLFCDLDGHLKFKDSLGVVHTLEVV